MNLSQKSGASLDTVMQKVQTMVYDSNAKRIIRDEKYNIHSVTWEDCARNKGSVWGPCISDMTLQVGNNRMPVIRKDNFTDLTWDVKMDKIPIVVGNEKFIDINDENDEKAVNDSNDNKDDLKTVSLKEYLKNFDKYATKFIRDNNKDGNNNNNNNNNGNENDGGLFASINIFGGIGDQSNKVNLLRKDETKDSHVIVSSQACFLPIENGKETLFNVALFNYQSRKSDPAILAIVATSKGTSAQIIEGSEQKLLFNNFGKKADFVGQRLSDNRIERGIEDLDAPMTTEEKQDNCIVIIQVPLKQKQRESSLFSYYGGAAVPKGGGGMKKKSKYKKHSSRMNSMVLESAAEPNIESAIIKVAPKTHPVCKCGSDLEKLQVQFCYDNFGKPENKMVTVSCDECGVEAKGKSDIMWHCKKEKQAWQHKDGYDLCQKCATKQLEFDELNGLNKIERDERYPVRVTLQYYKSTDNGVINKEIMKDIAKQLETSRKQSDYVGSLVTEYNSQRPTEWVKRYLPFIVDKNKDNNNNNGNNNNNNNRVENGFELIRDILGNLKLSEYYKTFVKNEINDSRLILLEDRDLERLFDKIGPQIVFRHWLRSYKSDSVKTEKIQNDVEMKDID